MNRQEDAQVRQVGASDPEQQHAFSKGGRIYVMVIWTGPSTSYDLYIMVKCVCVCHEKVTKFV